jgi:hypothetical protein
MQSAGINATMVEWAAHVDKQALLPSSLLSPLPALPASSESSKALVKLIENGNAGSNLFVEADKLEKNRGLSPYVDGDCERELQ